jgi:TolB-like protein/Tfp pilus assembly protein PilF
MGIYKLGPLLGAGGMGEVYRARDTKLGRDVAIKILPAHLLSDPDRRARLEHEARLLASLNHPNIGAIYGLDDTDSVLALVLELVEGETLAERIAGAPLPLKDAVAIARQIADALGAAHDRGIVHRDLKPANIKLTRDGTVKVLDFGIARSTPVSGNERDAVPLPTMTLDATQQGMILGTAAYMSPEQARGKSVDKRTDIWAFGCVLYEMLSGRSPFAGDTLPDTIAAILEREPDLSGLPERTPASLRTLVRRCLEKDPRQRLQDIGDARLELEELSIAVSSPAGRRTAAESDGLSSREPRRRFHAAGAVRTGVDAAVSEPGPIGPFSRLRIHRRVAWVLAGVLSVALMLIVALTQGLWRKETQIRSVAVLPLENLSGDPEQEYFADGVTDQLIADLSKVGTLRVISRTSVMQYKKGRKPLPAIAQELNVDAVVEGSVVRVGDRVRITAKLIRASTEKHLWGESYERDVRDVLALQSEVARSIASEVDIVLTPQEQARLASTRAVDPGTQQQVLLGRFYANKGTEDGFRKAVQHFEMAAATDPGNASAFAGLAEAYISLSSVYMHPREAMPKAKAAAQTALKLDESHAGAHAALGYIHLIYDWDGPAARQELQRAIQLNPSLATARVNYAAYLMTQDQFEEGVREIRRAAELDPLSLRTFADGASLMLFARRNDEALEFAQKGLELEPNSPFGLAFQGVAYSEQGRFEEAVSSLQKAARLDSSSTILALGAHVHAVAGRKSEARKLIQEVEKGARHRYFCPYEIGTAYVSLGENDTAYKWFHKGLEDRADCMAWLGV